MATKKIIGTLGVVLALFAAATDLFGPAAFWLGLAGLALSAAGNVVDRYGDNRALAVLGIVFAGITAIAPALFGINERWGRIGVLVGAAVAAIGKGLFDTDLKTPPDPPTGGRFVNLLLVTCVSLAALATACPKKKNGTPSPKPSQIVTLARASTVIPVGIDALSEYVAIRARYGANRSDAWVKISNLEQTLTKCDTAREKFASGVWDQEKTRDFLKTAAREFKHSVADGTVGVKNAQTRAEWTAWADTVALAIEAAYELSDQLKPLPETLQAHETAAVQESINPNEVSEIIAYGIPAAIKVIGIYRQTDPAALWARGKSASQACHENNKVRLAQLQ